MAAYASGALAANWAANWADDVATAEARPSAGPMAEEPACRALLGWAASSEK